MSRASRFVLTGGLAVALSVGGIWDSLAWQNEPSPAPIPTYPLPSGNLHFTSAPYPTEADPSTGQIVPNTEVVNGQTGITGLNFLTYVREQADVKRLDTPVSACAYYLAIGAVTGCGSDGTLQQPITFEQWKQAVKIGKYAVGGKKDDVGHFVNQIDLNLTRDHHMISYGPNQLAGYVCNHGGSTPTIPDPTGLFPSQREINALTRNIRLKQQLIACVAMEFSAAFEYDPSAPPPAGAPFTKFWIFGPEGALLSTVDLDGEGPKGVPHVCTACHGGNFSFLVTETSYPPSLISTQQFASSATGKPPGDVGAHFLPFDMANFAFASKLSDAEREDAIFRLNLDVYTTENSRSQSIASLISGWYGGNVTPSNVAPQFNPDYVSSSWSSTPVAYQNAYAHSCRTCHVAMENLPFEVDIGALSNNTASVVCGGLMPNAKVTLDRFWLSAEPGVPGQPAQPPGGQPSFLFMTPKIGTPCASPS
jgi:hypothetical protein